MFKSKIEEFKKNKTNINEINFSELPKSAGIYLIGIKDINTELIITENTTAIKKYNSKSLLYKKSDLKRKLENSFDEILYIGKAESKNGGLKKRIADFMKYANGQPVAHRGGRALWQIQNWQEKIVLYWCECENARQQEKLLLNIFSSEHKQIDNKKYSYPFANWRG